MNIKDRALRSISLMFGSALISAALGPRAWAQPVPIAGGFSAPIGEASAAAGAANVPAGGNAAALGTTAARPLNFLPPTASSAFLPAPSAAAPALAVSAAAPAVAMRKDAPPAQAPAAAIGKDDDELPSQAPAAAAPAAPAPERADARTSWDSRKSVLLSRAQMMKDRLDDYSRRRELEIGPAEFERELEKNRIAVADPELGKAEMTVVDGRRFVRVVHAPSELSFLFLDADTISRDSRHLRQIIARQFFDAGSNRADGRRGRDPVVVWQKDGRTIETEFHEKPAFPSADWWRQYWRATYKAPTSKTLGFGLFMGGVQGLLSWGVLLLTGTAVSLTSIAFTAAFGALIGAYMSLYRNWTYRGSALSQILKSALISLAFAYPLIILTKGLLSLTLASNILLLFNVGLNNTGKVAWQAIPKMFEKYQHYRSSLPLFWGFKLGDLLNQGSYLINWTLRLIALLIPTWTGYAPLLIGMGVALLASYWYAKLNHYPEAAQMFEKPRRLLQRGRDAVRGFFL